MSINICIAIGVVRAFTSMFNVFSVTLDKVPDDPEPLLALQSREEGVVVAVVPVAEDDLLPAEAAGPQAALPIVHAVHFCTRLLSFLDEMFHIYLSSWFLTCRVNAVDTAVQRLSPLGPHVRHLLLVEAAARHHRVVRPRPLGPGRVHVVRVQVILGATRFEYLDLLL